MKSKYSFFGLSLITLGVAAVVKKIRQTVQFNREMKNLAGQNPLDALFEGDIANRQEFERLAAQDDANYQKLSLWGKVKNFFINEEKPSTTFIKSFNKEKSRALDGELIGSYLDSWGYHNAPIKLRVSRAKSAYRVLKMPAVRDKYTETRTKATTAKVKQQAYEFANTKMEKHESTLFTGISSLLRGGFNSSDKSFSFVSPKNAFGGSAKFKGMRG